MELTTFRTSETIAHIVRRLVNIPACVLLVLGCVQVPLLHLHPNQEHHHGPDAAHRHSPVVHSHIPQEIAAYARNVRGLGLSHEDHDAEQITSFVAREQNHPGVTPAIIESDISDVSLNATGDRVLELASRGHDPPPLASLNPRAPPA